MALPEGTPPTPQPAQIFSCRAFDEQKIPNLKRASQDVVRKKKKERKNDSRSSSISAEVWTSGGLALGTCWACSLHLCCQEDAGDFFMGTRLGGDEPRCGEDHFPHQAVRDEDRLSRPRAPGLASPSPPLRAAPRHLSPRPGFGVVAGRPLPTHYGTAPLCLWPLESRPVAPFLQP